MTRAISRLVTVLVPLVMMAACSGPSAPSPTTSTQAVPPPAAATASASGPPASAAASGGFEFLGSEPAPGSEIPLEELSVTSQIVTTLTARLALHFNQSLPAAS